MSNLVVLFLGIVILSSNFVIGINNESLYDMDKNVELIRPSNSQTSQITGEQGLKDNEAFTENRGQWDDEIYYIANTDFGHIGFGKSCIFLNVLDIQTNNIDPSIDNPDIQVSGYVLIYKFEDSNEVVPIGLEKKIQRFSSPGLTENKLRRPGLEINAKTNAFCVCLPEVPDELELQETAPSALFRNFRKTDAGNGEPQ